MDDIAEKLSSLLEDPEGLNKIKSLAEGILSDNKKEDKPDNDFSIPDINMLMKLSKAFKSTKDDRINLLLALRPHLSEERKVKVDTAVKLLKIYSLMPLLKESGVLGGLF